MPPSDAVTVWFMEQISDVDAFIHGATAIVLSKKTAYQALCIAETPTLGKVLILDGKVQCTTADEFLYHEPLVHPACLANGSPQKVLVLGGGDGAAVREALRWKTVEQVVMVDIDREVVEACRSSFPEMHGEAFFDPRTSLIFCDALAFLEDSSDKWDIIISDITEPIENGPSVHLFTKEYFEHVKSHLAQGGVFVLQAGPVGPQYMNLYARLVNTVKAVFPFTLAYSSSIPSYPAPWGFVMGSSKPLNNRPRPEEIDKVLSAKTNGGFRMIDGEALLGLLQLPVYVRASLKVEQGIFNLSEPLLFTGHGNMII